MVDAALNKLRLRFWSKVEVTGGCWTWTASRNAKGYGRIGTFGRKIELTHRVAYQLEVGPIPEGSLVCHHCDNPPCVRPDHLFLSTPLGNMQDMAKKGRHFTPFADQVGERHPRNKLNAIQIAEIHASSDSGASLAARFGVNKATVNRIRRGQARVREEVRYGHKN